MLQFKPNIQEMGYLQATGILKSVLIFWHQDHPVILVIRDTLTPLKVEETHMSNSKHMGTELVGDYLLKKFKF